VSDEASPGGERARAAEVIAALSLATDLGIGVPLEHGLHSTLIAMRLGERLDVDAETASQTYYACLLFYVGCTANADVTAEIFGDDNAVTTYAHGHEHAGLVVGGPLWERLSDGPRSRGCPRD